MAKYVIGLLLAALVFDQITDQKGELAGAGDALSHLHHGWVVLGAVAEAGSLLAFAILVHRLLLAGQVDVPVGPMAAITLAANAITDSLPAGPVIATVYSFRQFERRGADRAVAGWSLVAAFVVTSMTLAVVAALGALVAGAEGASLDLVGIIVVVLLVTLIMGAIFFQKQALIRTVSAATRLCRKVTGRPRADRIDRILLRLTAVELSGRHLAEFLGWGLANWLLDCGCLATSFMAVGVTVPWKGLLLAYGAGQLAANLPITPGGLGVVEGSITIAIVAYGGAEPSTVEAVLLYRILSFWLVLLAGWGAWAGLAWSGRRRLLRVLVPAGHVDPSTVGTGGSLAGGGHPGDEGDIPRAVGG